MNVISRARLPRGIGAGNLTNKEQIINCRNNSKQQPQQLRHHSFHELKWPIPFGAQDTQFIDNIRICC